jgi:murein DD-endopeptidase MepM/ murein hydrolase activator NlpD
METALVDLLKKHHGDFHPVVPFDPSKDRLVHMDFTLENKTLHPGILNDLPAFIHYINALLEKTGARYGIGGYAEHRTVYAGSSVFDARHADSMPRRLHLGTDIWGKPYTAVMAPCEGLVHSFGYHDQKGNYGGTIILSHAIDGHSFFTLYGHLSLHSIGNIIEGKHISRGEIFAEFGRPSENGQWPPHLHFQLISDIGSWHGDYPGVCAENEKEKYLSNSPNPDLILHLDQYAAPLLQ